MRRIPDLYKPSFLALGFFDITSDEITVCIFLWPSGLDNEPTVICIHTAAIQEISENIAVSYEFSLIHRCPAWKYVLVSASNTFLR